MSVEGSSEMPARDRGEIAFWPGFILVSLGYLAFAAVIVGSIVLAVRHDPGPNPFEVREGKIRQCIADGGEPQFAVDRYGSVSAYFGCVKP